MNQRKCPWTHATFQTNHIRASPGEVAGEKKFAWRSLACLPDEKDLTLTGALRLLSLFFCGQPASACLSALT